MIRAADQQSHNGAGDTHQSRQAALFLSQLLQKQHHEQSRQGEIHAGNVEGQHAAQYASQHGGHDPVAPVQQRDGEIEFSGIHALRWLHGGDHGESLVAESIVQHPALPAQIVVFFQHGHAVKQVPGADGETQQEHLQRIEACRQQGDGGILGAAAEGDGAEQTGPQGALADGLHQHPIGGAQHQKASQNGDGVGEGGPQG